MLTSWHMISAWKSVVENGKREVARVTDNAVIMTGIIVGGPCIMSVVIVWLINRHNERKLTMQQVRQQPTDWRQ